MFKFYPLLEGILRDLIFYKKRNIYYMLKNQTKIILSSAIITVGLVLFILFASGFFDDKITNNNIDHLGKEYSSSLKDKKKNISQEINYKVVDKDEKNNIDVYKKVSPGVANITTRVFQYDFFLRPQAMQGSGSGIVIDKNGHILTNYHVIQNADQLIVTLNKKKYNAKPILAEKSIDLAIIKIKAPDKELHPIKIIDLPRLEVGQKVLAIGNPFGFSGTLTTGIISSLGRTVQISEDIILEDSIQTDASINPGNSGGPLLNTQGELIGVTTAIISPSRGSVGLGFAIPSRTIKLFIKDLYRELNRPKLGIISGYEISQFPGLSRFLKLPISHGFMITKIQIGSSAHHAGLRGANQSVRAINLLLEIPVGGDIILSIDGHKIKEIRDIVRVMQKKKFGDVVQMKIYRDNQFRYITVKLNRPR